MSFDAVARVYRLVETLVFGRTLQRARVAWLGEVAQAQRALIVGEGDGRFLERLLRVAPDVRVDCVEGSAIMIALATKRVRANPRVRFIHADLETYLPEEERYDLIVTHFVLDCFGPADVSAIVRRLASRLAVGGRWLLADFRVPDGGIKKLRARFWLAVMYGFFRLVAGVRVRRLVDPTVVLEAEGLIRAHWLPLDAGFIGSAVWTLPPGSDAATAIE